MVAEALSQRRRGRREVDALPKRRRDKQKLKPYHSEGEVSAESMLNSQQGETSEKLYLSVGVVSSAKEVKLQRRTRKLWRT